MISFTLHKGEIYIVHRIISRNPVISVTVFVFLTAEKTADGKELFQCMVLMHINKSVVRIIHA